jgi:hypothetical protein
VAEKRIIPLVPVCGSGNLFYQFLFSSQVQDGLGWFGAYLVLVSELQTINYPQELGEISESHQLVSLLSLEEIDLPASGSGVGKSQSNLLGRIDYHISATFTSPVYSLADVLIKTVLTVKGKPFLSTLVLSW